MKKLFNLLIVEDDQAHVYITRRILEDSKIDINVLNVKDGQEALNFLNAVDQSYKPDLILLDLRIPKIDGLELIKLIRVNESFSRVPLVVLTTSDAPADIEKAYFYGANSYLIKPLDYNEYVKVIESIIDYWVKRNKAPIKLVHEEKN